MEIVTGIVAFVLANKLVVLTALTSIVTLASAIANVTPTESDNKVVAALTKLIDFLALNIKK